MAKKSKDGYLNEYACQQVRKPVGGRIVPQKKLS